MGKKAKREAEWAEDRKRCRLSVDDLRMDKELGMSPRGLIKNRPNKAQSWKAPVKFWIRDLYQEMQEKRAKKTGSHQPRQERKPESHNLEQSMSASGCDALWLDLDEAIYVLHVFEKKTRRTPQKEIDTARSAYAEIEAERQKTDK